MGVCEKHGEHYKVFCHSCNQENIALAKKSHREQRAKEKKYDKKAKYRLSSNKVREKLKAKLQVAWRKVIFPFYKERGLTNQCWICDKPVYEGQALYGPQVAHYFAKSDIYQLWCDPVNSGICCYRCNVDRPHIVASMEAKMIKVWGKEAVDDLKERRDKYDFAIKSGMHPRYPPEEWFFLEMESLKKMVILPMNI